MVAKATSICPWKLRDGFSKAVYGCRFLAEQWNFYAVILTDGIDMYNKVQCFNSVSRLVQ
jgi:hypothetical protein